MKFNVLGVCNGQGIGLFPFKNDKKFQILGNLEIRREYLTPKNEQWIENFSGLPFFKSLEYCQQHLEDKKVHIIVGNPKCGASSVLRLAKDKQFKPIEKVSDEKTLDCFVKAVNHFKPDVFLLENLQKLLEFIPIDSWEKGIFPSYNLIFHCDSVSAWGNSQKSRKRLVIIGVKKTSMKFDIKMFACIQGPVFHHKTGRLLKDVPKNGHVIEDTFKTLSMFDPRDKTKRKLSIEEIAYLWTHDFKDCWKWPWINSKGGEGTLPGVYRNKNNGYPMTARKADRQFKENGYPMSPRELARIMGIPDSYKIYIDMNNKQYWINKARFCVTTTFPYEIGNWFYLCCKERITY